MLARFFSRKAAHAAGVALPLALTCAFGDLGQVRAATAEIGPDDAPRYAIREVLVQGAGVFKPDVLRALYGSVLTHPVTESEIGDVADALSDYYRRGGYFLASATVPKQRLDYGLLVVRMNEGAIDDVNVEGDATLYTERLQTAMARLEAVRPMTEPVFKQALDALRTAKDTRTTVELVPSAAGTGHYVLHLHLARGQTHVVLASRAGPYSPAEASIREPRLDAVATLPAAAELPALADGAPASISATPAVLHSGPVATAAAGAAEPITELAPDLMPRNLGSDDAHVIDRHHVRPAIGPFYVPKADARRNAYRLLDHGPGWYKRSEDLAGIPTALGLRMRDDETKVGLEAGIPYDTEVDGVSTRDSRDEIQVLFTVDHRF